MPKITFIDTNDVEHIVEASEGGSLMLVAVENNIEGIDAECGGSCACATCHCYVEGPWLDKVGEMEPIESELLDFTEAPRKEGSRLSCQVEITAEMDGIVIKVP